MLSQLRLRTRSCAVDPLHTEPRCHETNKRADCAPRRCPERLAKTNTIRKPLAISAQCHETTRVLAILNKMTLALRVKEVSESWECEQNASISMHSAFASLELPDSSAGPASCPSWLRVLCASQAGSEWPPRQAAWGRRHAAPGQRPDTRIRRDCYVHCDGALHGNMDKLLSEYDGLIITRSFRNCLRGADGL